MTLTEKKAAQDQFITIVNKVFNADTDLTMDEFMNVLDAMMTAKGISWHPYKTALHLAEYRYEVVVPGDDYAIQCLKKEDTVRAAFAEFINDMACDFHRMVAAMLIFTDINRVIA